MPEYVDARLGLARVLADRGRSNEALAQYAAVLKIDPNNAEARDAIAHIRANRSPSPSLVPSVTSAESGKMTKSLP